MGQRSFRTQLADSISKDFYPESKRLPVSSKNIANDVSFQPEKYVDVEIDFYLEDPLRNIKNRNKIKNGIINSITSGNITINKLKLNILTSLHEKNTYTNLNFHVVFGVFFNKDIKFIEAKILSNYKNDFETISNSNSLKKNYSEIIDNRSIMNRLIDCILFKSKVNVVVNNKFIYHIMPGFRNHSIVLSYKNTEETFESKEDSSINEHNFVETLLKDFIHHSYSEITTDFASLQSMKLSINRQFDDKIDNIILPTLSINIDDYNKTIFKTFFKFLSSRFKFISIKFKVNDDKISEEETYEQSNEVNNDNVNNFNEKIIKFNNFLTEIFNDLNEEINIFNYAIFVFEFLSLKNNAFLPFPTLTIDNASRTKDLILRQFKNILIQNNFQKVAIVYHQHEKTTNITNTNPDNISDKYTYIYYNRKLSQTLVTNLKLLQAVKILKLTVFRKKPIFMKYLEFLFGQGFRKKFFVEGSLDFSLDIIPNEKIHLN